VELDVDPPTICHDVSAAGVDKWRMSVREGFIAAAAGPSWSKAERPAVGWALRAQLAAVVRQLLLAVDTDAALYNSIWGFSLQQRLQYNDLILYQPQQQPFRLSIAYLCIMQRWKLLGSTVAGYITLELFRVAKNTNTAKPLLYTVCRTRNRKQLPVAGCRLGQNLSTGANSENSANFSFRTKFLSQNLGCKRHRDEEFTTSRLLMPCMQLYCI